MKNQIDCIALFTTVNEIEKHIEEFLLCLSVYRWSQGVVNLKFIIFTNHKLSDITHTLVDSLCKKYLPEPVYGNYDILSVN